jgi:hypothetical protein
VEVLGARNADLAQGDADVLMMQGVEELPCDSRQRLMGASSQPSLQVAQ